MIRIADLSDVTPISILYREQFKEMSKLIPDFIKEGDQSIEFIEKTINNEDSDIIVYENDGKVLGFILLQAKQRPDFQFIVSGKHCFIMDLIVTENYRGKGFGTALMNSAKDWAKAHGCGFINLDFFQIIQEQLLCMRSLALFQKHKKCTINLKVRCNYATASISTFI